MQKNILIVCLLLSKLSFGQCDPVGTINENFDTFSTSTILPPCWSSIVNATSITGSLGVRNTAGEAHTAPNFLQLYTLFDAASSLFIISPKINSMDGIHAAAFFINSGGTGVVSTVECGYMTNPADTTTFVSIMSPVLLTTAYQRILTPKVNLSGELAHFVIKIFAPLNHTAVRIDGFQWAIESTLSIDNLVAKLQKTPQGNCKLTWKYPDEDVATFEIEKAVEASHFNRIGEVSGIQGSSFEFTDYNTNAGQNIYRLKLIYYSGEIEYSSILLFNKASTKSRLIVPFTLVHDELRIQCPDSQTENFTIAIANSQGAIVWKGVVRNSYMQIPFRFSAGMYYAILLKNGEKIEAKTFVKQ